MTNNLIASVLGMIMGIAVRMREVLAWIPMGVGRGIAASISSIYPIGIERKIQL